MKFNLEYFFKYSRSNSVIITISLYSFYVSIILFKKKEKSNKMTSKKTKEDVLELITKQKKAKIKWVASVIQITENAVLAIAKELGLVIENDSILIPSESVQEKEKIDPKVQLIDDIISIRTNKLSAILKEDLETISRIVVYRFVGDFQVIPAAHAKNYIMKTRERFRHRWEFVPKYRKKIECKGLVFSGHDKSGEIMQILEIPKHPFFMASQFHPEFTTRVLEPNPLFFNFVKAASARN